MPGSITLRVVSGPMVGQRFTFLEHEIVVVGRSSRCRLRLPKTDTSASRHHFVLELNPPDVVLRDLGSRHGTLVNGEKLGGRSDDEPDVAGVFDREVINLGDGDEVQAGRTVFRVEIWMPELCPECGTAYPADSAGTCPECGSTAEVDIEAGLEARKATCVRCGKDVVGELSSGRRGSYVCQSCRGDIEDDPLDLVAMRSGRRRPGTADGVTIPGYTVVDRVGVGGMGAVYLARRDRDRLWVALKVLLAKVAVDEAARRRFARESSIVEQLHHEHIVQFYERGSVGSAFYFTMEFCPGGSASELMKRRGGKLSLSQAGPLALQTLDALDYAHRREVAVSLADGRTTALRGVVHRDIKPDNILLSGSDRAWDAKLSDFGLAKCFAAAGLSGCTVSGHIGGALPYMPPEQVREFRHLTPVSDVWSLAASFYTMLAGIDPRGLSNAPHPLQAVLEGKITPLQERQPDVPVPVAKVVDRALREQVHDRYPDAASMRDALTKALYGADAMSPSTSGTVLVSAAGFSKPHPAALLKIGFTRMPDSGDKALLDRLQELHETICAHPDSEKLRALHCTGDGFLGICDDVEVAISLCRGAQLASGDRATPLRRTVHWGAVQSGPAGDLIGVELQRLFHVHTLAEADRAGSSQVEDRLPQNDRLLLTSAAADHLQEELRTAFAPGGEFNLRDFAEPESVWVERLSPSSF